MDVFTSGGTDAQELTYWLGGSWRNGHGQAACPVCQKENRSDQNAVSLTQIGDKLMAFCFKSGCSFVEIANAAGMPLGIMQIDFEAQRESQRKQAEYSAAKLAKARSLWEFAKPINGTKAEAYLRSRCITVPLPDSLRFMTDIYHGPSASWVTAMVADVQPAGGVHRTYFDKKGNRLTKSAKMMLGPCAGGAVRLSETGGPLVVCEGIETGLSLLSGLLDRPHTVWAALSTSGIKGLSLPDTIGKLTIATDGDEAGRGAGNSLATHATALGWKVSMLPAPDGLDWNDVLMANGGAE